MKRNTEEKDEIEVEILEKGIWFTYAVLLKSLKMHFALKARNTLPKKDRTPCDPDYEEAFPWPYYKRQLIAVWRLFDNLEHGAYNDLFFLDLILKLEITLSCQQTAEHM